jgi:hypothetical protein
MGVMGRFCLWETVWHGLHLDWRTASRRWSGKSTFNGGMAVYYPAAKAMQRAFAPRFETTHLMGVGAFLPPSDIFPVVEKRPGLHNLLTRLESAAPLHFIADHYWLEMK